MTIKQLIAKKRSVQAQADDVAVKLIERWLLSRVTDETETVAFRRAAFRKLMGRIAAAFARVEKQVQA